MNLEGFFGCNHTVFPFNSQGSCSGLWHRQYANLYSFKTERLSLLNRREYSSLQQRNLCFLNPIVCPWEMLLRSVMEDTDVPGVAGHVQPKLTRQGFLETPSTKERDPFQRQIAPTALSAPCQQSVYPQNMRARITFPRLPAAPPAH